MEILKLIAQAIFVKEAANVGSKFLNNKRITKTDEQSLGLAVIAYVLVNLPPATQNNQFNS
jgi:hypothetical protein